MRNFPKPSAKELLKIYRTASLIKLHDDRVISVLKADKLTMPYYSVRGQEIIPAAISIHLRDDDFVSTIYRGTHDMIAKGFPLDAMWAELAGRVDGACKGKGGPMHLTYPDKGIMLTTGIVGSSLPIANGLAWSALLDESDKVTIANFGDGAANIGAFHESLNMAGLWKLPVVFVCQNNLYAEHTSFKKSTAVEQISCHAASYGFEGITVNGNDANEMYGAAKIGIDRARKGEGPTLIEAMTYRFNGHFVGDSGPYMDKEEYASAVANDPIVALREEVLSRGVATEPELAEIEAQHAEAIEAAMTKALESEFPNTGELLNDVFSIEQQGAS